MDTGEKLGEIPVALVGHDHRLSRFGDQEVGAGDSDVSRQKAATQHLPRIGEKSIEVVWLRGPGGSCGGD